MPPLVMTGISRVGSMFARAIRAASYSRPITSDRRLTCCASNGLAEASVWNSSADLRVADTRSQRLDATQVDVPHLAERPVIVPEPAARWLAKAELALPWPLRVKSLLTPVADGDASQRIPMRAREEVGWNQVSFWSLGER